VSELDYGLSCEFWDVLGRPLQMRFRRDYAPGDSSEVFADTGQLIGIVSDPGRGDFGETVPLTRAGVARPAVEAVLEGWLDWAAIDPNEFCPKISLPEIARRLQDAGLT
jgi:hypothetical protein